jgi:hypothetical protein
MKTKTKNMTLFELEYARKMALQELELQLLTLRKLKKRIHTGSNGRYFVNASDIRFDR